MSARAWGWFGLVWAFFWFWFTIGAVALGLIDGWGLVPGLVCAVALDWQVWWFWRGLEKLRDRDEVSRRIRRLNVRAIAFMAVWNDRGPGSPRYGLRGHALDCVVALVNEVQQLRVKLKFLL